MAKQLLMQQQQQVASLDKDEVDFWTKKLKNTLRPIPEGLTQANELKGALRNLRNTTLIAMFLINLVWIILLYSLTFSELEGFNLTPQVLSIMFLAVYGLILLVQFAVMLVHRLITLAHYIARLNQKLPVEGNEMEQSLALTMTVAANTPV